jgi:hypothetical protein
MVHLWEWDFPSMHYPGGNYLTDSELFFQGLAEPGPSVLPVPLGHRQGEPRRLARLLDGDPTEQVKVRDPRRGGVFLPESGEQLVQRQDKIGILSEGTDLIEKFKPDPPSTNRKCASWTSAVAFSAWPGFSCASFWAASRRRSSYTSGSSCSAARGSPCSMSDRMRVFVHRRHRMAGRSRRNVVGDSRAGRRSVGPRAGRSSRW